MVPFLLGQPRAEARDIDTVPAPLPDDGRDLATLREELEGAKGEGRRPGGDKRAKLDAALRRQDDGPGAHGIFSTGFLAR